MQERATYGAEQSKELYHITTNQDALINCSKDQIWSVDKRLMLITANDAFRERVSVLAGDSPLEGKSVLYKEFGEAVNKKWAEYYTRALTGERFTIKEELYNTAAGRMEYGQVTFNPMYNAGDEVFGVACYAKDTTADTVNLIALETAKNELQKIMDSSLDMICVVDENDRIVKVSAASEQILGYKPEELTGKPLFDFVYPPDKEQTIQTAASVKAGQKLTHVENRYVRKDGSIVPLIWSARWDPKDKLRYGIARDATESYQREMALKTSNERFEYAAEATSDIIWDWNLETNAVYYSGNIEKLFGHHKAGLNSDNLPFFFENVHPDDRERVVLYPEQVKFGAMRSWSQEYRFKKADGHYAIVLDKGIVIRDEHGVGKRMIGAIRDITTLRQQNERLTEIALINAHEIRRPVATILGLLPLFRDVVESEASKELLIYLESVTLELDTVIRRIIEKTVF